MMSGEQRNLEESLKPFFGNSNGSLHFFNSNYFHSNYENAVNTKEQADSLFGTPVEAIMFGKYYNKNVNKADVKPEDIHYQYIDFIVKTALYHREIDRSTLMGSEMIKFKDSFRQTIDMALDQSVGEVMRDTQNNNLLNMHGIFVNRNGGPHGDATFADIGLTNSSNFFEFIVAYLFMLGKDLAITEAVIRNVNALKGHVVRMDINNMMPRPTMHSFGNYIKALVGTCGTDGSIDPHNSVYGNYCLASFFNPNFRGASGRRSTDAANAIKAIIDKIVSNNPGINGDDITQDVLVKITDAFVECILLLTRALFEVVKIEELQDAFNDLQGAQNLQGGQNMQAINQQKQVIANLFRNALDGLRNNGTEEKLKQCLADTTFSEVKKLMNILNRTQYTFINNSNLSKSVVENVFYVWDKLSPNARTFYGKHLHIFAKQSRTRGVINVATLPALEQGYIDLMPSGKYTQSTLRTGHRLNLMKESGIGEVLFGQTLPWLPMSSGKIGDAWYTAADGEIKNFKPQADTIRRLYQDLYKYGEFKLEGERQPLNLPISYDDVLKLYKNVDFDIDDMQIIYDIISARVAENENREAVPHHFEDLFEDLTTNEIYKRDNNGLYKMVNGQKVYAGEKPERANCASSFLNNSNNDECIKFVGKYLISGDINKLAECLDELKNQDLFNRAHNELTGMHPEIAIKILKTFGVNGKKVGRIHVVESLHEWINRIKSSLSPNIYNAIVGNNQLKNYISGVISFVNANPAIMNPDLTDAQNIQVPDEIHPEDAAMGKTGYYRRPSMTSQAGKLFIGNHLNNYYNNVNALGHMSFANMGSADMFTNTIRGQVMGNMANIGFLNRGQMGGNSGKLFEDKLNKKHMVGEMESALFEGLLNSVVKDLEKSGTPLRREDQEAIMGGINIIKRNEEKLAELYVMLRTLVDLSEFFKASYNEKVEPHEINIKQIRNRKNTIEYLTNSVGKMEQCIGNNVRSQSSVCNDMIKNFASIFESAGE